MKLETWWPQGLLRGRKRWVYRSMERLIGLRQAVIRPIDPTKDNSSTVYSGKDYDQIAKEGTLSAHDVSSAQRLRRFPHALSAVALPPSAPNK